MLRIAPRQVLRQSALPARAQRLGVRYQSTAPIKRRSFKNTLARWGIAIGGIYWYNTSPLFNEPPSYSIQDSGSDSEDVFPTYASVAASSRFRPPHPSDAPIVPATPSASSPPSINPKSPDPRDPNAPSTAGLNDEQALSTTDPESLHQEAAQEGAFNPETGEINWDCPCLGGMAHGPCGEEFRAAFSCFVYSDKEPKGIDCVDKFEGMQTCFRAHPEVYASEIEDDENMQQELEQEVGRGAVEPKSKDMPDVDQPSVWTPLSSADDAPKGDAKEPAKSKSSPPPAPAAPASTPAAAAKPKPKAEKKPVYDSKPKESAEKKASKSDGNSTGSLSGTKQPQNGSDSPVPKAAHDAR